MVKVDVHDVFRLGLKATFSWFFGCSPKHSGCRAHCSDVHLSETPCMRCAESNLYSLPFSIIIPLSSCFNARRCP